MKLTELMTTELVETELKGTTRDEIIEELIHKLDNEGSIKSKRKFKKAILAREKEGSTGIGYEIAIPHGKSKAVTEPRVIFGKKASGVDWNSADGTLAKLIFMIAVPQENQGDDHLKILQILSRKLMNEEFREQLLQVESNEEAYNLLEEIE